MKRVCFALLAIAGTILYVEQASAQAPTSAYNTTIMGLGPVHYFPFNDPYASTPGSSSVAADYGTSGGSGAGGGALSFGGTGTGNNGTYVTTSGSANTSNFLTDSTQGQLASMGGNNKGIIGSNVGVAVTSQFTNYTSGSAGVISSQLPGFNPNYAYDNTSATNRTSANGSAFYADQRGAVILAATNSTFLGDANTGAFTIAGWFLGAGQGTTSPNTRFFDAGQPAGTDTNRSFQIVGPGSSAGATNITFKTNVATYSAGLSAWYPSGNADAVSVGGDSNLYNGGQWHFIAVTFSGTDAATRFANFQYWDRDYMSTNGMRLALGGNDGATGTDGTGLPKAMFREFTKSSATVGTGQIGAGVSNLATWNRALAYDEIESLYVAAVTPVAGTPTNVTLADGGWGDSSKWQAQTVSNGVVSGTANLYPLQHGQNQQPYYDVQINHNITAGGAGLNGYNASAQTVSFRSNMYSLTVSAASSASLTLAKGTTLRTAKDMNLNGIVNMNGDGGRMSPDNWTASSKLDAGRDANIGSGAVITLNAGPATGGTNGVASNNSGLVAAPVGNTPIGSNAIVAQGNLNIAGGAQLIVSAGTAVTATTGAQLYTIAQANSVLGNGARGITTAGTLSGKFNVTLNQPADTLGRKFFVLYEGASTSGTGAVDSVKVGFARLGDANLDNNIDTLDVNLLVPSFVAAGTNNTWRTGDFTGDGRVNVSDVNALRPNFNTSYFMSANNDNYLRMVYNPLTGNLQLVDIHSGAVDHFPLDGVTVSSASGQLIPGGWTGPTGFNNFYTGTPTTIGFNAFYNPFFTPLSSPFDMGNILPPGLSEAAVLQDLTITYFQRGNNAEYTVPEPGTLALLVVAGLGLGWAGLRRRRAA